MSRPGRHEGTKGNEKCEENNREADRGVEVTGGKLVTLHGLITKPHGYRPNEMRPRVRMILFLQCNTLALGNCERMTDNDTENN